VTKKDPIHEYNSCSGIGKVTSITIMDASEKPYNQIKLTIFGDQIARYYGMLEEGRVYIFQGCDAKVKNEKYNKLAHVCELTLRTSGIIKAGQDFGNIENNSYNFQ
jgi:replication factor A1